MFFRLKHRGLISDIAGEVWYAGSIMAGLLLFGLAVFFFIFGALPYWFKLHKHLSEILGCESSLRGSSETVSLSDSRTGWALTFPNGAQPPVLIASLR